MLVSLEWLADYVRTDLAPDALADVLTMAGLEVEGIDARGARAPEGVVVGHVLTARPHPNADRLTLTTVDVGADGPPLHIVCGAPNVAAGQKVAVAPPGTTLTLPGKDGGPAATVTLDRRTIRGEVSEGMICAEDEIGLGADHAGILVLADAATPGEPLQTYLARHGARPDTILEVNVTPNRPDATSHVGVARDVAAVTGRSLKVPVVAVPAVGGAAAERVRVTVEAPEACPRYAAVLVEGVTVGPSPVWLRERLDAVGVRSINNVVDVTNYVLHERGQPLHAFDFDRLAGGHVVVRHATPGEPVETLDGKTRPMPDGALLICDAERPVAVAGVMGGANSEVTGATTTVLLEAAYFDPSTIRRASKALGLSTDASYRFERGVDPTGPLVAAARAAALLVEVAGGRLVEGAVDAVAAPYTPRTVTLRLGRLAALLGAAVPADDVRRILKALGFTIETEGSLTALVEGIMDGQRVEDAPEAGTLRLGVPPWRPDVTREVDVVEEVGRIWGYDRLPAPAHLRLPAHPPLPEPVLAARGRVRAGLAGLGFREVYTNSLLPRATAEAYALDHPAFGAGAPLATVDPAKAEPLVLRPALLPGLAAAAGYNARQGRRALRLFETGHVFRTGTGQETGADLVPGVHEREHVALVVAGLAREASWDAVGRAADLFDAKGAVEAVLAAAGVEARFVPADLPGGLVADALTVEVDGATVGLVGVLAPAALKALDARGPLAFAEFDLAPFARAGAAPARFAPFSRSPEAERDLAFVLPRAVAVGDVLATLRTAGGPLLRSVRVFDLYEGARVGAGRKSAAFAVAFGAEGRTLREAEVEAAVAAITAAVGRAHGGTLRR